MTPRAQNIAISEALGWVKGFHETLKIDVWSKGDMRAGADSLPDHLGDLNLMHAVENTTPYKGEYLHHLSVICYRDSGCIGNSVFATAAQRAEAFLKTIGKWQAAESDKRV